MTDKQHDPTVRHPRGPLAWVGGLAVVGVIALAFAIAIGNGFGAQTPPPIAAVPTPSSAVPTPSEAPLESGNPAAGGGVASCLVYDPANLHNFDSVFDGTVTAVDGDQVTFKVNEGWKGADGSTTLTARPVDIAISGTLPAFKVDGRYLVTALDTTISACGYTLDYDADQAAAWAAAFGS